MPPPEWDRIWMGTAKMIGMRSHCALAQIGAVVVTGSNRIVATGYNGPPANYLPRRGLDDCTGYCYRAASGREGDYAGCPSIHAEANALLFCDRRDREGGTIYITGTPCWECCKLIANSGLHRLVYEHDRDRSLEGLTLLRQSQLVYEQWTT